MHIEGGMKLNWIAFIVIWQRFEDYVVQPAVYGRALHVNPIVTILAVLAGAALLGILGALIAIPTAAAIQILLTDWWSRRRESQIADNVVTPGAGAHDEGSRPRASGQRVVTGHHAA
jgi:predicted PurR-regulated permease PerM